MLEAVAEVALSMLCSATGHGVLWALSLGRWRAFQGREETATLAGITFWILIGVGVAVCLLRP